MYESHFGLSGSPFQLNPDPAFYFDSRGHSNALAYLKFGAHQGEGFIVVTGEIGAGKTTLVRTLLEGLNPEQVVAAQVVSTQLESGELLQAILMSFGIASSSNSKAHLIGSLEAFLTSLAAKGRRALLIIDEAQNLKHEAVEELRMLSNFQLGKYGLLQSFLVGQPELRQLLQSKSMEQLRQRVIASCHLGPLQPAETRAYIEHRLHLVGWANRPQFEPESFERVHSWTGGVPRKINRLCNRLLLGAFLSNDEVITPLSVDRTATELKSEIGELSEIPEALPLLAPVQGPPAASAPQRSVERPSDGPGQPPARAAAVPRSAVMEETVAVATVAANADADAALAFEARAKVRLVPGANARAAVADGARSGEVRGPLTVVPANQAAESTTAEPVPLSSPSKIKRQVYRSGMTGRPLICLIDSASDFLKAGTLAEAFLKFPELPRLIAVHPGPQTSLSVGDTGADELPMPFIGLHLEGLSDSFALQTGQVLGLFEQILNEFNPHAVLAMGNSDALLACSLLANKRGTLLFRIAGGQRKAVVNIGRQTNGALIDKISDALYVDRMDSYYTLYQEGIKSDRVLCVGNLVGDMLRQVLPHAPSPAEVLGDAGALTGHAGSPKRFALVTVGTRENIDSAKAVLDVVNLLCEVGAQLPVLWPVAPEIQDQLRSAALEERLRAANVTVLAWQGYLQLLGLLENAKCLVCGADDSLADEAMALRIPSVTLGYDKMAAALVAHSGTVTNDSAPAKPANTILQELTRVAPTAESPAYWDSGTATRIANHLLLRLPKVDKAGLAKV